MRLRIVEDDLASQGFLERATSEAEYQADTARNARRFQDRSAGTPGQGCEERRSHLRRTDLVEAEMTLAPGGSPNSRTVQVVALSRWNMPEEICEGIEPLR